MNTDEHGFNRSKLRKQRGAQNINGSMRTGFTIVV
jgi:hypothetical protein